MSICKSCRKKDCEFRGVAFKNLTIYCASNCARELKTECEQIATPEFRKTFEQLKNGGYSFGSVNGMLKQMEVVLNAADNILA